MTEEPKTYKVAVLTYSNTYNYSSHVDEFIPQHITNWVEVGEDDFNLLSRYMHRTKHGNNHHLVVVDNTNLVPKLVSECIELAKKEQQLEEERSKAKAKAVAARKKTDLEKKRKKFEALKKELGE